MVEKLNKGKMLGWLNKLEEEANREERDTKEIEPELSNEMKIQIKEMNASRRWWIKRCRERILNGDFDCDD